MAAWIGTSNSARDLFLELLGKLPAPLVRLVPVDDELERVDRLAVDEDVQLDQVGRAIADSS